MRLVLALLLLPASSVHAFAKVCIDRIYLRWSKGPFVLGLIRLAVDLEVREQNPWLAKGVVGPVSRSNVVKDKWFGLQHCLNLRMQVRSNLLS